MFGWRARLGLIMPSNNTVMEPELLLAVPEGITLHGHRVGIRPEDRKGDFMEALRIDACNNGYKIGPVDCVAYCCLTTSFYKGLGYDQELIREMESNLGMPVTTAATSMVRALKASNIKKIAIASPFRPDVNSKLEEFLEGNGFEIAGLKALDPAPTPKEVVLFPTTVAYRLAKSAIEPESDAVFLCATDFPSLAVIDALENDLKKPVISTNQAILWDMLRILDMKTVIRGFGSLLEKH